MKDMLDLAASELAYGFAADHEAAFEVRSAKYNPHFIQLVAATEPVLVAGFDMTVGPVQAPISLMVVAEP